MTLKEARNKSNLLLDCISGSRAYGLNNDQSDTDYKGIFVAPENVFFSLDCPPQINSEKNDEMFYEWSRFVDLLLKNNPNILELMFMPEDCILYKHPIFDSINPQWFLSKLCEETFVGYAYTQIKKARGLNKKIFNPIEIKRKDVLDYCYVIIGSNSFLLKSWLNSNNETQEHFGLTNLPHIKDTFNLYRTKFVSGIVSGEKANEIKLSSIEKGEMPIGLLYFNKDAYSIHCKEYKEYWEWVKKRNEQRFKDTLSHNKNYDAKNMMHTFRLLDAAENIAKEGTIILRSQNKTFLLDIRNGKYDYDQLLEMAQEKTSSISSLFSKSDLPETPNIEKANDMLYSVRKEWYNQMFS